jgi:hypothetical protein
MARENIEPARSEVKRLLMGFAQKVGKMPRACPVEYHARDYTDDHKQEPGGHGLGPWRFTFLAK